MIDYNTNTPPKKLTAFELQLARKELETAVARAMEDFHRATGMIANLRTGTSQHASGPNTGTVAVFGEKALKYCFCGYAFDFDGKCPKEKSEQHKRKLDEIIARSLKYNVDKNILRDNGFM